MPSRSLVLSPMQHAEMVTHVQRHAPEEACGILAGTGDRVTQVFLVENMLHSPVAYEMNPVQQVTAMLALEAAGWDICGIFHSHPAGPALPSATDLAQAYYPDAVYVILAPNGPTWGIRGFSLSDGRAVEIPLVVA